MKRIVANVGHLEAIRLVSEAYNAEILANRMGRMETASTLKRSETKDLLRLALERVTAVCELAN